jgi:hypothetical protein
MPSVIALASPLKRTTELKKESIDTTPEMLALPSATPSAAHSRPHCLAAASAAAQPEPNKPAARAAPVRQVNPRSFQFIMKRSF